MKSRWCAARRIAIALRFRHHDDAVHDKVQPAGQVSRSIFNVVEQARCEALGSKRMAGVAQNLTATLDEQYRRQVASRITERIRADGRSDRMLTREVISGTPPPAVRQDRRSVAAVGRRRTGADIAELRG